MARRADRHERENAGAADNLSDPAGSVSSPTSAGKPQQKPRAVEQPRQSRVAQTQTAQAAQTTQIATQAPR